MIADTFGWRTNEFSGTVTPIRTATNTALRPIKTGVRPIAIAA